MPPLLLLVLLILTASFPGFTSGRARLGNEEEGARAAAAAAVAAAALAATAVAAAPLLAAMEPEASFFAILCLGSIPELLLLVFPFPAKEEELFEPKSGLGGA